MAIWFIIPIAMLSNTVASLQYSDTVCAGPSSNLNNNCNDVICCGTGYHMCDDRREACCSDINVYPVSIVLVILGPLSLICSLALTAFVLKTAISTAHDGKLLITQCPLFHCLFYALFGFNGQCNEDGYQHSTRR